ncbi:MAG: hypothetical protein V3W18_00280 [candidate division Zixibacteria bacterium]
MSTEDIKSCICGSPETFIGCCQPYFKMLDLNTEILKPLLIDWRFKYGPATSDGFHKKSSKFSFRISLYLDSIIEKYMPLGYLKNGDKNADEAILSIKHNILLTLFGAYSCISEGLFIQSGILLRSAVEDSFVLVDVFQNSNQFKNLIHGKYSTNNIITRIKKYIPEELIDYYGHFSANFSHFGPIHPAPYMPRACYEENWVIVLGLENIIKAILTFHISLERIYFKQSPDPVFWKINADDGLLLFDDNNKVYKWVNKLIKELQKTFPPNERKDGFEYSEKSYKLKKRR